MADPADLAPSDVAAMTPRDLYEANLPLIERAIAFVCRRNLLFGPDADDFQQSVHLKLIADDHAVLRKFKGTAVLDTYLGIVVRNHLQDWRRQRWGKWGPSAEAQRLGKVAVKLDELMHRDGLSCQEACQTLLQNLRGEVPRAELERIAALLPQRPPRRLVGEEELADRPAEVPRPEGRILESELQTKHQRLLAVLDAALKELPADDRLLIEMCILRGRKVTEAARFLSLHAKPLFRRRDQILARLKRTIEAAGFSWKEIAELLGIGEVRWE